MTKLTRHQAGDTLVEVLIAITILSVILSTSYALATRAFRTLQIARDQAQATFLAQEQIEAVKSLKDSMTFASFLTYLGQTTNLGVAGCNAANAVTTFNLAVAQVSSNNHWCLRNASTNPSLPSQPLYQISDAVTTQDTDSNSVIDQVTLVVTVSWDEIGSGTNRSLAYTAHFRATDP